MLKKLLKYDLKNLYKFLIIFYLLVIFGSIITRIFLSFDNSLILYIISQICSGFTISMMINIIINNLIRSWTIFKDDIYGDKSYLTHTLPVTKKDLYLSKFISTIITLFTSFLIILLAIFIAYYSKENIEFLINILLPAFDDIYNLSSIKIIVLTILTFFLEMATLLQAGLTGIIIGHKKNHKKTFYSILFGFITYIIIQIICLLSLVISSLYNTDIMYLFTTNTIGNPNALYTILYLAIIVYAITMIITYFINLKLFKKGVNVD